MLVKKMENIALIGCIDIATKEFRFDFSGEELLSKNEGSIKQKTFARFYCTVKLHVADCALPPLGSEATTFQ